MELSSWCSKGKAVTTQTPEIAVAESGGFDMGRKSMGDMETALRLALCGMPALNNRDAGANPLLGDWVCDQI